MPSRKTKEDLVQKRFGKLVVVEYGHDGQDGRKGWLCKCDCGGHKVTRTHLLTSGRVKSCGCLLYGERTSLLGQRFTRLVVIERAQLKKNGEFLVKCQCDCGKEITLRKGALTSKNTRSCGCLSLDIHRNIRPTFQDLKGQVFGRLTVTCEADRDRKEAKWLCQCTCGNTLTIPASYLRHGKTKSCGCLQKETVVQRSKYSKYNFDESLERQLVDLYFKQAKERKNPKEFLLAGKEIVDIILKPCFYCGQPPSRDYRVRGQGKIIQVNGIDRIHNNLGYIKNNCVPCCTLCNRMKHVLDIKIFLEQIKKISDHRILRNS